MVAGWGWCGASTCGARERAGSPVCRDSARTGTETNLGRMKMTRSFIGEARGSAGSSRAHSSHGHGNGRPGHVTRPPSAGSQRCAAVVE
eukprot:3913415-Rhodomonas_salina.2